MLLVVLTARGTCIIKVEQGPGLLSRGELQ